jgi:asparagine synthase (glutamine-hydrolysing)
MRAEAARHVCAGHLRQNKRKLTLARDRLDEATALFAPQRQALLRFGIKSSWPLRARRAQLTRSARYLYHGYARSSAFVRIHKLPPGHLLEFAGRVRVREYWDFPVRYAVREERRRMSRREYRLSEATKIRLLSDVPLRAFLSGGTDSSSSLR